MNLELRKASIEDLDDVLVIYKNAINLLESKGIYQWDDMYPNKDVLKEDIEKEELFLGEINGAIACAFVINEEYDEEYNDANWEYKNSKFKVIHRLCVNVDFQNMGIGKRVMKIIEEELRKENVECIRLDTFSKNPFSIKLYENIGFKKVGEANWRKGLFNIYEKNILNVYN